MRHFYRKSQTPLVICTSKLVQLFSRLLLPFCNMDTSDPVSIAIDVVVLLSSGAILIGLKLLCRKKLYPWIGSNVLKLSNEKFIWHFSKQLWKLTWHSMAFIWCLCALIPTDYWPCVVNPYGGTSLIWEYANNSHGKLPSDSIRFLYVVQMGYYIGDFIFLVAKDRPNDLINMCVHHIAALALLAMSYLPSDCWQIGSVILLYHDMGDVGLYICKTLHYAQFKTISEILFVLEICVWIWSRLIWFPRIIVSLYIDIDDIWSVWQVIPCSILLWTLAVLHTYWAFLMLRVLYRAVKGEGMKDARDKEDPLSADKENIENNTNEDGRGNGHNVVVPMETETATHTNGDAVCQYLLNCFLFTSCDSLQC